LVEVLIRELRMPRDLYLVYRRRGPLSHAATAMLHLLRPGATPPSDDPSEARTSDGEKHNVR
jgi:hypothetical protein